MQQSSDILFAHGRPKGLHAALDWLIEGDARPFAKHIDRPTALFYGERDRLTPPSALHWLETQLPNAQRYPFTQASHAPFLSHEAAFCRMLRQHIQQHG